MSPFLFYSLVGVALFTVGLHALLVRPALLRKILALNIMGGGGFLVLVAVAYRNSDPHPDPVPHAMVLTGIVVAVSATAFALALLRRLHALTGESTFSRNERDEK